MLDLALENIARVNRRQLFGSAASGVGLAALASLFGNDRTRADEVPTSTRRDSAGLPDVPHFPPKAKRVVVLWQGGGPSHVKLDVDKPKRRDLAGHESARSV